MPKLVVCRCDPTWLALAVCETCEMRDRELLCSPALVLDARDYADRERDRADAWRMEWEAQR